MLQRLDERLLGQILGIGDVADDAVDLQEDSSQVLRNKAVLAIHHNIDGGLHWLPISHDGKSFKPWIQSRALAGPLVGAAAAPDSTSLLSRRGPGRGCRAGQRPAL